MVCGPATFVVMFIVGVLIVAGVLIFGAGRGSARRSRSAATTRHPQTCPGCGHANVPRAAFCARCGYELQRQEP